MIELDPSSINDFVTEAAEHLEEMESILLRLVEQPAQVELLNEIFRPVHTIKGVSQFIGLQQIARLSHKLEDLLDLLRKGKKTSNAELIELLIEARDRMAILVNELATTQTENTPIDDLIVLIEQQITASEGEVVQPPVQPAIAPTQPSVEDKAAQKIAPIDMTSAVADEGITDLSTVSVELPPTADLSSLMGKTTIPDLMQTSYDEEGDQELFAIFMQQLQEKIAGIQLLFEQIDNADPIETLTQCVEEIKVLKSAANYMGYQHLTEFYQHWLDHIAQAQHDLAIGQAIACDFMLDYIQRIRERFFAPSVKTTSTKTTVSPIRSDQLAGDELTRSAPTDQSVKNTVPFTATPQTTSKDTISITPGIAEELLHNTPDKTTEQLPLETAAISPSESVSSANNERIFKKSVRVDAGKIDTLMNQVGELIVDRSYFVQLFNEMRQLQQHLKDHVGLDSKDLKLVRAFTYRFGEAIVSLSRIANELQESVMKVRMLPISQLFNRYPRLIHDLTRDTHKRVRLEIRGEETELDRMIIEEIADPLIHIIRNAIDHGFETTQERLQVGKPEIGTLLLEAYHESNHIVIEVTDDGRGIDPEKLKATALQKNLLSKDEINRMSERDLLRLIMLPGFSTATKITGTSGRGVGMDIVKKNVEKLNGSIEIDSQMGLQTQIRLKIPLTLAIISALMVRVGKNYFTIPLANVEETLRIMDHDTSTIEGVEVIHLRGKTMPVFRLATLFNMEADQTRYEKSFVVIVNSGFQQIGLVVDELIGQEDVVIKPLVDYLQERSGFSGATIIGDGRISLILDVYELINMTKAMQTARHAAMAQQIAKNLTH